MHLFGIKLCLSCGLVLMLVSGSGCPQPYQVHRASQATPDATSQPDLAHLASNRVYDPQEGFSISVPPGWRSNGQNAFHFLTCLGPCEGAFTINLNVYGRQDDGTPVEKAKPKVMGILPMLLRDYRLVEEGFAQIAGSKAYYASGRFRWDGLEIQNLQYFIRGTNNRVYILTFAAPAHTFGKHRSSFEETARTVLIQ